MLQRYTACMATIQIRDVPEDVHATYRARAAAAGMSLQAYLRRELEIGATRRTPAEIAEEVARERAVRGDDGFAVDSTAALVRDDRERR